MDKTMSDETIILSTLHSGWPKNQAVHDGLIGKCQQGNCNGNNDECHSVTKG